MDKTPALIDEWVQQGLVIRYDGRDGPVLFFRGFRRHQVNMPYAKEQESRFPPPPGWVRMKAGLMPENEDLRHSLAQRFDTRTAYYKALTSDTSKIQALCSQHARNMHAEDQDQVKVQDQHEVEQHVVAAAAEKISPPPLVVQENNTRTHEAIRNAGG